MTFELRTATEADRTYLARLNFLADVWGDETKEHDTSPSPESAYYVDAWTPEHGGIIAWDGTNPAGGIWLNWGDDTTPGYGHVKEGVPEVALAVEERYKGQGLGTQLLRAAEDLAREKGATQISLSVAEENPRARRLYLHVGYQPVSNHHAHDVLIKDL